MYKERPFPSCWVLPHSRITRGNGRASYPATARFRAANASGNRAGPAVRARGPAPDPAVFADAVARYRVLERLREFRQSLYECLDARADALFELTDAVLCADHAVTSLVQLCLEPEFTRGHGALYDALSAGRIDDERLFSLLAAELPQAVDGPEARAWIAEHDVIDRGLLDKALAGLPADEAAQVRDACARWARLRFAVDATAYPRPDAWCSPGREHVHNGACHCQGLVQDRARLGVPVHRRDRAPAHRVGRPGRRGAHRARDPHGADDRAGEERAAPPARRRARGEGRAAVRLRRRLQRRRPHRRAPRLPGPRPGPARRRLRVLCRARHLGRQVRPPARRGAAVHCLEPADFAAAAAGTGPRGRKKPLPPNPEPDETLVLPDTPLYGTVRAEAWHGVHPLIHGDRGWFAGRKHLPVLPGTLVHVTVERLPDGRDPHRAMWLWHAGPGPLSLDELWRAYLARFDIEHAFRLLKGALGLTAAKVSAPEQADRWARLLMAACAQLLLARPLAADLRRPWEKQPDPARPLAPGRVRRGFRNIRRDLGTPARVAKPTRPGPGRPKGSSKGPAPRYLLPGEADMPRTEKHSLTREKVKT